MRERLSAALATAPRLHRLYPVAAEAGRIYAKSASAITRQRRAAGFSLRDPPRKGSGYESRTLIQHPLDQVDPELRP